MALCVSAGDILLLQDEESTAEDIKDYAAQAPRTRAQATL